MIRDSIPYALSDCDVMMRYLALLALVLAVTGLGLIGAERVAVAPVAQARLKLSPAHVPPADDNRQWHTVSLPDDWRARRPAYGGYAWYRVVVPLESKPSGLWAVYLPHVNMNAAVYLNGHYLGSGGPFEPRTARNWNRPLYFPAPAGLLHAGDNVVHVRVKADAWAFGLLGRFYVAPDHLLREAYTAQYRIQITFVEIITLTLVALAILIGVVWLRRRHDACYGWFALASLIWAFNNANLFVVQVPLPPRLWEWAANISLIWMVLAMLMFMLRYLGQPRPRIERLMFSVALIGSALAPALPERWFFPFLQVCFVLMLGFSVYVLSLAFVTFMRERSAGSGMLSVVGLTLVVAGAHDLLLQLEWFDRATRRSSHQGSLVLFLVIGGILVKRFMHALHLAETLSRDLERRVADKHLELQRNYERVRELEREQVLVAERERITRDIHDGMGGQLIAALAVLEAGGAQLSERLAEALHAALDDLRLMIDSLDPVDQDLGTVLGMFRNRMEPRLQAVGLVFHWRVEDIPPIAGLGPHTVLQVLRILQEAMCNAMRHAQARSITVSAYSRSGEDGRPGVIVELADDGSGLPPDLHEGRGMSNMRRRAGAIGASFEIVSRATGTAVCLWLPSA